MTGPEHYTAAEELIKEAAKYKEAAAEDLERARGSHLPEKEAYVTRAQVSALIYSGMMTQAGVHARLANAAATALTGPMAGVVNWEEDLHAWGQVASDQYPTG
jgi:hypothetical protein